MSAPVASGDLEVLALSKLFFLGLLDDRAERARVLEDLVSAIDRERASLEGFGEHLDAVDVPDEFARVFHYQRRTLDYGVMSHRAALDWFLRLAEEERTP